MLRPSGASAWGAFWGFLGRWRGGPRGDLVGIVGGGQAGADVQELGDPRLADQVADRAAQERPVGPGQGDDVREHIGDPVTDRAVDRVVVLAAEPVVPDPGRVRHAGVDLVDPVHLPPSSLGRLWRIMTAGGPGEVAAWSRPSLGR